MLNTMSRFDKKYNEKSKIKCSDVDICVSNQLKNVWASLTASSTDSHRDEQTVSQWCGTASEIAVYLPVKFCNFVAFLSGEYTKDLCD